MMNAFSALMEARDPSLGRFRSYRLEAGTDLFGAWLVEVEYGRIGVRAAACDMWPMTRLRQGSWSIKPCTDGLAPRNASASRTASASCSIPGSGWHRLLLVSLPPTCIISGMSQKPLVLRLYSEPHLYELARAVGYGGKSDAEMRPLVKKLIAAHGDFEIKRSIARVDRHGTRDQPHGTFAARPQDVLPTARPGPRTSPP